VSRAPVAAALLVLAVAACGHQTEPKPEPATRVVWTRRAAPGIYYGSPALSGDEATVYIGTSLGLFGGSAPDHAVLALDAATGSVRWRRPLGVREVRSTPAVAADGSIFLVAARTTGGAGAYEELLHLSATGDSLGAFDIDPSRVSTEVGLSAPAIGPDGTVYAAGDRLYAIRPDGTLKWAAFDATYEARHNSPVVGSDGTVYFVYHNIPLTALDPADGHAIWSCPLGANDHCFASPAIGADGTIFVATSPGIVYAVSAAGQIVWTFAIASAGFSGFLRSSPAVDADGTIYFGVNNGSPSSALFALRADGSLKWVFEPADLPPGVPADHFDIYSSPAIGSDGTVYFGQELGRVYALDPADGSPRWIQGTRTGITWSSPALAADGRLFIADLDGNVYAIRTESAGLRAGAPWPKYRHDARNTGRAD
jgi:outer membrane protein assembly factor BamB